MPNWAFGSVSVTGTKSNIISFTGRFIYDDNPKDETVLKKQKLFARSFVWESRQSILDEIEAAFSRVPEGTESTYTFYPDFAWSANTCLINGYPEKSPDECITLMDACKADRVTVEITTNEPNEAFEEYIYCDEEGGYTFDSKDMPTYECPYCGNTQSVSSFEELSACSCYECGELGLVAIDEETTVS